jgi:hypothetical protein
MTSAAFGRKCPRNRVWYFGLGVQVGVVELREKVMRFSYTRFACKGLYYISDPPWERGAHQICMCSYMCSLAIDRLQRMDWPCITALALIRD